MTIYGNDDHLMTENDLNRHSRGDRTMKADTDGYYTIYMSSDAKGKAGDANFLPIPEKPFYAIMRFYGADEGIQSDEYQMPEIKVLK